MLPNKGSMYQILDLLRANNLFCIRYNLEEGCTNNNCIKKMESNNFLNPYIVFKSSLSIKGQSEYFLYSKY